MRNDEFFRPLSFISVIILLAVKAFAVTVFVVVVLMAGFKNQIPILTGSEVVRPLETPTPLPNLVSGQQGIIKPTPIPATPVPTQTMTLIPTLSFTDTPVPTEFSTLTPTIAPTNIPTEMSTATAVIPPTLQPTSTSIPVPTPTTLAINPPGTNSLTNLLISPLQGISISELSEIISQPFILPPAGEDSGHHGVDFAFWRYGDLASIEGVPILSIFPGKVASAYSKIRTPYGYMVMVETPLANLPTEVIDAIKLPDVLPNPDNQSNRLTCPTGFADWWSTDAKSLYVLYGHLGEIPAVQLGQNVKIGDFLGVVGNSGASSNPHLHLEMRIGPSNATFYSMGHYDSTTTDQERHNYCMWRVSGEFEMFDPMMLYSDTGE